MFKTVETNSLTEHSSSRGSAQALSKKYLKLRRGDLPFYRSEMWRGIDGEEARGKAWEGKNVFLMFELWQICWKADIMLSTLVGRGWCGFFLSTLSCQHTRGCARAHTHIDIYICTKPSEFIDFHENK